MKLSVIIPVYNEVESIQVILKRVQAQKLANEIIVVDDCVLIRLTYQVTTGSVWCQ